MADFAIIEGDKALFMLKFGMAVVAVKPGIMQATGKSTIGGKKICVDGDEKKLEVPGCAYMTPEYTIPGVGTIKIESLAGNQKTKKTKSGGKPIIIKGGQFKAKFEVQTPAKNPIPPTKPPQPDATPSYSGQGQFVTTNTKVKVT